MKWVQANSNNHRLHIYELRAGEEKLVAFSYQPGNGTIRIASDHRRVFQLRKEGFRKNRTALLNEYGVRIASIVEETDIQTGSIDIEEKKFRWAIHNRLNKDVFIYEGDNEAPIVVCELPPVLTNHKALLLVLCWYKLQPQKQTLLQTA
jgi:hypothetical protein